MSSWLLALLASSQVPYELLALVWFCFFLNHIILFAVKKRGGCSLEKFAFCVFFGYFHLAFKNPYFDRFFFSLRCF